MNETTEQSGNKPRSMIEWVVRTNGETMLSIGNPDRILIDVAILHESRKVELTFADGVEVVTYGGDSPDMQRIVRMGIEKHQKLFLFAICKTKELLTKVLLVGEHLESVGA